MDDQALKTFFKFDEFDLAANGKDSDIYLNIKGQTWEIDQDFADAIDGRNTSAMVIGGRNGNNLSIEGMYKK
jgi:hypothetical protein